MTEAKTKSVNMTFPALFSYVMNTNYRSMSGILGLVLSFGAIVMLVIGWNAMSGRQKAIFIIVALMFTVINPLSLAFKTFKQLKTSPSYKQPLVYTFSDGGIGVSRGRRTYGSGMEMRVSPAYDEIYACRLYEPDACICDSARPVR